MNQQASLFINKTVDSVPLAFSEDSLRTKPSWSVKGPPYCTIVADPPWPEYGGGKIRRGANKHYPLMSIEEIEALGSMIRTWRGEEGCHLYLWVTNNYLPAGLRIMAAWGFEYRNIITWGKVTANGQPAIGLGQYFRGASEQCLFGVYGHLPYRMTEEPEPKRGQGRTLILAPRQEHSKKPDALMDMAELVSHPPYLEMFARSKRLGWDSWGSEAPDGLDTHSGGI